MFIKNVCLYFPKNNYLSLELKKSNEPKIYLNFKCSNHFLLQEKRLIFKKNQSCNIQKRAIQRKRKLGRQHMWQSNFELH